MKLCPGTLGVKPPMDGGLGGIALPFQGLDFPGEGGLVRDAAGKVSYREARRWVFRLSKTTRTTWGSG